MTTENNVNSQGCSDDDVVSFSKKFYKVENIRVILNKFLQNNDRISASHALWSAFSHNGITADLNEVLLLLTNGIDSEILKIASNGWKKGKLKINVSLEFIPDEPEIQDEPESNEYISPLDEIRNHPSFPNS